MRLRSSVTGSSTASPGGSREWQHNPYLRANGYGEVRLGTGIRITEVEGDVEELTDAATSQEITP